MLAKRLLVGLQEIEINNYLLFQRNRHFVFYSAKKLRIKVRYACNLLNYDFW